MPEYPFEPIINFVSQGSLVGIFQKLLEERIKAD